MRRIIASLGLLAGLVAAPAQAALDVGDPAPDFTLPAALNGKAFQYRLAEHLAKGPVVLYFFPAAFSEGCSIEAHQFAEAIGKYEALGASVIGVSGDDLELITRFSVQVCQGKFPVAADEKKAAPVDMVLKGDAKCTRCHDETESYPVLSIGKTKHGVKADGRTPTCTSCHGESRAHEENPQGLRDRPKVDRNFKKGSTTHAASTWPPSSAAGMSGKPSSTYSMVVGSPPASRTTLLIVVLPMLPVQFSR